MERGAGSFSKSLSPLVDLTPNPSPYMERGAGNFSKSLSPRERDLG
jgi:hypothetical protein